MSDDKQQSPEEQGFNDSELQDIMEEIESLEKEFTSEAPSEEAQDQPEATKEPEKPLEVSAESHREDEDDERTDLQKAIDKEVEELEMESNMDEMEKALDDAEGEHEEDDVFSESDFEEESHADVTPISAHQPAHQKGIELKAQGPMNLELSFPVGEQKADFKVLSDGFSIEFNGMVVHIDEKEGCHISMPGGGEFTLPLGPNKVKKAS